jgi:meso-butanediol dehydrogenase / (S,S)-butanediol dehydrogenase / diacetyl reductase
MKIEFFGGREMKLKDRVAVVTGGGRGIGKGIVMRLAAEGAHVLVADLNERNAQRTAQEVKRLRPECNSSFMRIDVSLEKDVEAMVARVVRDYEKIDILVNSAGILAITPAIDITEQEWNRVIDVNLKGTFLCSKHAAREMIKVKKGKIINIASNAGKRGDRFLAHYCASKFGVIGLTQVFAKELGPFNLRVNAICPGFIETDMFAVLDEGFGKYLGKTPAQNRQDFVSSVPIGRMGTPDDVGSLAAFLASDDADYIHGQAINLCGGVTPY